MPRVEEFVAWDGRNHFRRFFASLSTQAAGKVVAAIARLGAGSTSGLKSLGGGLAEWRIDWGPGLRIYLHQEGDRLILLLAGSDKSDQRSAIAEARVLLAEYRERRLREPR